MCPEADSLKWLFPYEKATLHVAGEGNNNRRNALVREKHKSGTGIKGLARPVKTATQSIPLLQAVHALVFWLSSHDIPHK